MLTKDHMSICRSQIDIEKQCLQKTGGEGGIRTPDTRKGMSDFESGAFNRALPPLRITIL
jgi:hypothetical protein